MFARRPGRQGRAAAAGRAGPAAGRAVDCERRHGNPPRRGREKDRSCQRRKRAGGCRNASRRMQKIQAGRRSVLGGSTMKTQEARSGDPAIRRSGDPAIRRSGDPAIRRSGDPAIRRSGDPAIRRSGDPAIRRSGDPAIRRSGIIPRGIPSALVNPCTKQFFARPAMAATAAPSVRTVYRPSLTMVIASSPNLSPGRRTKRAPLPSLACSLSVAYAEPGGEAIARSRLRDTKRGSPVTGDDDASRATARLGAGRTACEACASRRS